MLIKVYCLKMISTHFIPHANGTSTQYTVVKPMYMTPFFMLLEITKLIDARNIQEGDLLLVKFTVKEELKEKFFIYRQNNFLGEFVNRFGIDLKQLDKFYMLRSVIHMKQIDDGDAKMFETLVNIQNARVN